MAGLPVAYLGGGYLSSSCPRPVVQAGILFVLLKQLRVVEYVFELSAVCTTGNELAETSRDQTILPLSVAHAESAAVPDAEEHASLCAFRGGTMMDAV